MGFWFRVGSLGDKPGESIVSQGLLLPMSIFGLRDTKQSWNIVKLSDIKGVCDIELYGISNDNTAFGIFGGNCSRSLASRFRIKLSISPSLFPSISSSAVVVVFAVVPP